jgi:hypothetical protein
MDGELSLLVSVARLSLSYKPRLGRRQQLLARIRRVVCTRHIAEVEIERMRCMHDHVAAIACHQPLAQLCNGLCTLVLLHLLRSGSGTTRTS